MKRAYMKPKAKMVNFQYTERVVASGSVGTQNSGMGYDLCQQSATTCTIFFYTDRLTCAMNPLGNPGMPGPTI